MLCIPKLLKEKKIEYSIYDYSKLRQIQLVIDECTGSPNCASPSEIKSYVNQIFIDQVGVFHQIDFNMKNKTKDQKPTFERKRTIKGTRLNYDSFI